MASPPSLPASGAEERFCKAKKHLWQVLTLSLSLSMWRLHRKWVRRPTMPPPVFQKARTPSLLRHRYSLIACSALMLTPHVLAIGWFIIQCLHRASESPALEENQTDLPAERRERGVKSPSQEGTRMRSSHSATPDRPRSPQLTGKPQAPECTLRAPSKFVLFFAPLHGESLIGIWL